MRRVQSLEELVFWQIYLRQQCLRSDLAQFFHVSPATVSRAIGELLEKKLIVETCSAVDSGGRKPQLIKINPKLATLLGVEIDEDRVTVVVTDMAGGLMGRGAAGWDAGQGPHQVVGASREAIRLALGDAGISPSKTRHLGVGHPGYLDLNEGSCLFWANVDGWRNVPLRAMLTESFHIHVALDDRSRALALGERRLSPEDGRHPNAIYVQAGTGIGAGIFINGRLFPDEKQSAGEIGHVVIDANGPPCRCGNRGCVEAFASIGSVLRHLREAMQAGADSVLRNQQAPEAITIEMVTAAANQGDPLASAVLERAARALGLGVLNVVQILNLTLVVLTGRLARLAGKQMLEGIRSAVQKQALGMLSHHIEIRLAIPKKDISAVGCALLAAEAEAELLLRERLLGEHVDHPHLSLTN